MRANRKATCMKVGLSLTETIGDTFSRTSTWMLGHLADCPRCQRIAYRSGRLRLALLLTKTQSHRPDLLMRANQKALSVLKHSLRHTATAEKLRHAVTQPSFRVMLSKYTQSIAHAAACLAVLLLMRTSIFSSMVNFQKDGRQAVERYYARHLDEDILRDVL